MDDQPYLLFPSDESLYASLLVCDRREVWQRAWAEVRLEREGRALRVLTTEGLDEDLARELGGVLLQPRRRDQQVWELPGEEGWEEWRLVERRRAERLLHLFRPRPAPDWRPPALAYLKVSEPGGYGEVVRANLILGNDRLRIARLDAGGYLVEVHRLSSFLVEKWRDRPDIGVYHQPAPSVPLLAPWGCEFPLVRKLGLGEANREGWWLVDGRGGWLRLRVEGFRNLYELLELDPTVLQWEEEWLRAEGPAFQVRPRLTPAERSPAARLRLVPAEEREALEELLARTPDDHLMHWLMALLEDPQGGRWFLLWDRSRGGQTLPATLPGQAFYLALEDSLLFLPAGMKLTPVLSRRVLADALPVGEGALTLVEERADGRLRVWQVSRSHLHPMREAVDYLLVEHIEDLRALRDRIEFAYEDREIPGDGRAGEGAATRRRSWRRALRGWWDRWVPWRRSR